MALTDKAIRALKATGERYELHDDGFPAGSFSVRVAPTGERTFYLRYRTVDGRQRRLCLGAYPVLSLADARDKARRAMASVANGEDPAEERQKRRRAGTFQELWGDYLERYCKPQKRAWRYDDGIGRKWLLPAWKHRKADDISRADVVALLDSILDTGSGVMANRVRAIASSCFNYGIGRGLCADNPVTSVPKPAKEQARERVFTHDEIRALWRAFEGEPLTTGASFMLRLVTAQRGQEVLAMRWVDIDGDVWTIPGEIAKNGLAHRVPLSAKAIDILDSLRGYSGSGLYVFPARSGPGPMTSINKAKARIRMASGVADFNPHDLRRTAATLMTGQCGVARLVLSKILNHAESGVTAVYDRANYFSDMRSALDKWAEHLDTILKAKGEPSSEG